MDFQQSLLLAFEASSLSSNRVELKLLYTVPIGRLIICPKQLVVIRLGTLRFAKINYATFDSFLVLYVIQHVPPSPQISNHIFVGDHHLVNYLFKIDEHQYSHNNIDFFQMFSGLHLAQITVDFFDTCREEE